MNQLTAYHSPINIDEREEEGQILGAARWFVFCLVFVLAAAGSALFV